MLIELISPPTNPVSVGSESEWVRTERELGIRLPTDFHDFIKSYGSGLLGNFYWVWNPYLAEFVEQVNEISKIENQCKATLPEYYPFKIFPDSPGFLPCASDDNGNYYGWLTKGNPDQWTTLTHEVRGSGFKEYEMTFTEYLLAVFKREIKPLAGGYPLDSDFIFLPG